MITFTHPGSLGHSLRETFEFLVPQLSALVGYPAKICSFSTSDDPAQRSCIVDDLMTIQLAGPRSEAGRTYLQLPLECKDDEFARRAAGCFVAMTRRISGSVKRSWDLKALLIREDKFLWDNLVLSAVYRGNHKYNAVDLVSAARDALSFRYESEPAELGIIATWNWHTLKPVLVDAGCTILDFNSPFDLRSRLLRAKAAHKMSDGKRSFFIVRSGSKVGHLAVFPDVIDRTPYADWELVPAHYRHLRPALAGRDLIISNTRKGQSYVFSHRCVLKWSPNTWHRVSGPPLSSLIDEFLPHQAANRVSELTLQLSERGIGGIIAVTTNPSRLLAGASSGVLSQFNTPRDLNVENASIDFLRSLASIDGAIVLDSAGSVCNAGVILQVPAVFTVTGEGARTAAAAFASTKGLAIKISHDGPITIFRDGKPVRQAA